MIAAAVAAMPMGVQAGPAEAWGGRHASTSQSSGSRSNGAEQRPSSYHQESSGARREYRPEYRDRDNARNDGYRGHDDRRIPERGGFARSGYGFPHGSYARGAYIGRGGAAFAPAWSTPIGGAFGGSRSVYGGWGVVGPMVVRYPVYRASGWARPFNAGAGGHNETNRGDSHRGWAAPNYRSGERERR